MKLVKNLAIASGHRAETKVYIAFIMQVWEAFFREFINRLTAVDAYMRKSEGPSQNKS